MKKVFLSVLVLIIMAGCKKSEAVKCAYSAPSNVATATEISYLQNYISSNNITATQHASGAFYTINQQGTGPNPTVCSNITIKYVGRLFNGSVFDSNSSVTGIKFALGSLIAGFQRVLPVLKAGGNIDLYIPPSLGYGSQDIRDQSGNIVIPANSYLKFNIDLLDVQ